MIKSELIVRLVEQNPHLYAKDATAIVNTILGTIVDVLARGDRVELRDFGVFSIKTRSARAGRNPRNGATVAVEEKHAIAFRAGRGVRDVLRGRTRQVGSAEVGG